MLFGSLPVDATVTDETFFLFSADPLESETVYVKLKDPVPEGVPERMPDVDKASPAGSAPVVRLNEYGGTPPDTCASAPRSAEYGAPIVPFGSTTLGATSNASTGALHDTVTRFAVPVGLPTLGCTV